MRQRLMLVFFMTVFFCGLIISEAVAKDAPEAILSKLPTQFGEFIAEPVNKYDEPAWGASIGYNSLNGTAITVYVYDMGVAEIPDGLSSDTVRQEKHDAMEEIKEMVRSGVYTNYKLNEEKEIQLDIRSGKKLPAFFWSMYYEAVMPEYNMNFPTYSSAYVTVIKNHVLKIRVSRPMMDEANETNIDSLISSLIAVL